MWPKLLALLSQHNLNLPSMRQTSPGHRIGKEKRTSSLTSFPGPHPDQPPCKCHTHPVFPEQMAMEIFLSQKMPRVSQRRERWGGSHGTREQGQLTASQSHFCADSSSSQYSNEQLWSECKFSCCTGFLELYTLAFYIPPSSPFPQKLKFMGTSSNHHLSHKLMKKITFPLSLRKDCCKSPGVYPLLPVLQS